LQAIEDPSERFYMTMRTIQGAVIVSGALQFLIAYSGIITVALPYISPVTIAPVIAAIGLGLYGIAFTGVSACWSLGLLQIFTVILFSQYMKKFSVLGIRIFALFPVILAIAVTWSFGGIMTAADVWEEGSACRTDANQEILAEAAWFRVPYPFQWGIPIFKSWAVIPMWGGMLAGMIESIGDYYSCARIAGAPPPTPGIVSRGLGAESLGIMIAGIVGTSNATTSYSENIGALAVTGVGSRVVVQCGAVIIIVVSLIFKIGAMFATMPGAMTSGLYCTLFGLIVALGLSNLQYIDLNSPRNQFIIGFAIFNSMSIAGPGGYMETVESNPFGDTNAAEIAYAIFSSPMIIAFLCGFLLDNTVSGTREERGLHVWDRIQPMDVNNDPEYVEVYSLPICLARLFRNCGYLEYPSLRRFPNEPVNGYVSSGADLGDLCCPCWFDRGSHSRNNATSRSSEDGDEGDAPAEEA
jgi:solute carrier family 23 (nucleobase transporter), member 1